MLQVLGEATGAQDPQALAQLILDFRRSGEVFSQGGGGMYELWRQLFRFDPGRSALQGSFLGLARGNLVAVRSTCFSGVVEGYSERSTGDVVKVRFAFDRRTGEKRFWCQE